MDRLRDSSSPVEPASPGNSGFKLLLLWGILGLAIAAAYTSVLIIQRQKALAGVSRYNITWDASQSLAELLRLETVVGAYAVPGSGSSKDRVQLRLEIVANRVGLLTDGQVDAVLEQEPDLKDTVAELALAIPRVQALSADLDRPGNLRDILRQLMPLNGKMTRLASIANAIGADRVAADQLTLSRVHWVLSAILVGLIVCSAGLVLLLLRHNELLGRAQRGLRTLAGNLEGAGHELENANQAAHQANIELQKQNQRFDAALNNMSHGLCMADAEGRVIVCNQRFSELFGLQPEAVAPGVSIADMVREACESRQGEEALLSLVSTRQFGFARQQRPADFFCEGEDGRALAIVQRPMEGGGWVATYEDVTERRRVDARIRYMAHHDALTNLPNRVLLRERMETALRLARQTEDGVAVLLLDLDLFKDVNDTLGHPAGDALLEMVGRRLRHCVGSDDVVSRLGGDEFAVLQVAVHKRAESAALAERIVGVLQAPYEIDGQRITVTASLGIAAAPDDGWDPDQLMKSADMALYRAKARGRAMHCFFEPDMEADVQERRRLGLELREALAREDFEVFYQPIVYLANSQTCGFEALIRWKHRDRGLILPDRFIPLAEELGLITALGEWTLRQACRECATWPDDLRVAVNLSPRQFVGSNLVDMVQHALRAADLPPTRLELEITESLLLQENEYNIETLFALRALGIRIALDDFGTGYSSLSYLRRFPFDKIKVDRSFVQGMADNLEARAIVQSIADLAPKLGMRTTAEGIETLRDLTQVCEAGCSEGQGYYFGRPMRRSDIGPYLSSRPAHCSTIEIGRGAPAWSPELPPGLQREKVYSIGIQA